VCMADGAAATGIWVLMGVATCGKSTLGRVLAERTGGVFIEGDERHPPANCEKMAAGIPLTDEDREPWLAAIITAAQAVDGRPLFIACSALREQYRARLRSALECGFIYLRIGRQAAERRGRARRGHFFDPGLIASQYATLEEPSVALVLDAERGVDDLVASCLEGLRQT
jgi:gluconokinase